MSDELSRTREHLELETVALLTAIVSRETEQAEDHALTIINLIHHLKRIEGRKSAGQKILKEGTKTPNALT